MKTLALIGIATALIVTAHQAKAQTDVGYTTYSIKTENRPLPLNLHVWYPAKNDGTDVLIGANPIFRGEHVSASATPQDGSFPIVLMSHGSGGKAINMSWLADALAGKGMIVIAPDHPGTTSGDSTPQATLLMDQRPADISGIIDRLEDGTLNLEGADVSRIGLAGFSLGGLTAFSAAGAELSADAYQKYCEDNPNMMDCRWFKGGGIDLSKIDRTTFEGDFSDDRIQAFSAIDPGYVLALTHDSLSTLNAPFQIINLGSKDTLPPAVDATPIAPLIEGVKHDYVERSHHFSFLGLCTKGARKILASSEEGPLCDEPFGRDRTDIHAEIKKMVIKFFVSNLNSEATTQ